MPTTKRFVRGRRGFTLIELMVVAVLLGLIGTMLTGLLVRQQRFHRAVTSVTDARARMRDISTILPTDIRSISSVGTAVIGSDILAMDANSLQIRAFVGTAVLCNYAAPGNIIELPPQELASGSVLTAWINPPAPGDIVFLYNDSTEAGNIDDEWMPFTITDTISAVDPNWCSKALAPAYAEAADDGQRRYRITINGTPNPANIRRGAAIRIAREVRYSAYQGSDNQWYVGYQRCTPSGLPAVAGVCGDREVLAGPILPASADTTTSGIYFNYYNQNGGLVTSIANAGTIARINVGIRTTSESMRRATATDISTKTGGDSLKFVIGIRNRI
jgi:prepilin-type N-terminal cleavage/methylation domain-containing protein